MNEFLADAVSIFHALFVLFMVVGVVLAFFWKPIRLPVVAAAIAMYGGQILMRGQCPLTILENALRGQPYSSSFLVHYAQVWCGVDAAVPIMFAQLFLLVVVGLWAAVKLRFLFINETDSPPTSR